jgi:hypothetical protein
MDTSSTFYKHMKQTFSGDSAPVGSAYIQAPAAFSNGPSPAGPSPFGPSSGGGHVSDIRSRLNQILQAKTAGAGGSSSQGQQRPSFPVTPDRASQVLNSNRTGAAAVQQQPPNSSSAFAPNPVPQPPQPQPFQQPSATGAAPGLPLGPSPVAARPAPPAAPLDSPEDMLTADELEALRVIELDDVFSVFATAPSSIPPGAQTSAQTPLPPLQQLCDSCTAKVFPRHVVLAKTLNGAPVVELVIQELSELSEDTDRCSLTFVLAKPTGTALIEVCGRNPVALTAFYKLVCSKRNKIERGAPPQSGPSSQHRVQ